MSDEIFFNDSRNTLEDALGLTDAAVLSNFWASAYGLEGRNLNLISGSIVVSGVRVGPGQPWALIYAVLEIWAIAIMIWLMWVKRTEDYRRCQ